MQYVYYFWRTGIRMTFARAGKIPARANRFYFIDNIDAIPVPLFLFNVSRGITIHSQIIGLGYFQCLNEQDGRSLLVTFQSTARCLCELSIPVSILYTGALYLVLRTLVPYIRGLKQLSPLEIMGS